MFRLFDRTPGYFPTCRWILPVSCVAFASSLCRVPPRSPNLNAFAERWVRPVKYECLAKLILFGERSLKRVLAAFIAPYHTERNSSGQRKQPTLPCPSLAPASSNNSLSRSSRRLAPILLPTDCTGT